MFQVEGRDLFRADLNFQFFLERTEVMTKSWAWWCTFIHLCTQGAVACELPRERPARDIVRHCLKKTKNEERIPSSESLSIK